MSIFFHNYDFSESVLFRIAKVHIIEKKAKNIRGLFKRVFKGLFLMGINRMKQIISSADESIPKCH